MSILRCATTGRLSEQPRKAIAIDLGNGAPLSRCCLLLSPCRLGSGSFFRNRFLGYPGYQIRSFGSNTVRLLDDLVAEDADKIDGDTNVLHDETFVIKRANKHFDAFRESEDDQKAESNV